MGALPALPRIGNVTRRPATRRGGPSGPARPLVVAADAVLRRGAAVLTDEEARQIRSRPKDVWTAADRDALLRLLAAGQRGWEMFQILDSLGWVTQSLPEWAHVVAAPQSAPFHLHPLDVHLWRAVTELTSDSFVR